MLIGELAERARTTARALRYYEAAGLLSPRRQGNGYRQYDPDDVVTVRQIRALLAAGFGTELVRELLPCATGERPDIELCPEVAARMREALDDVETDLAELTRRRSSMQALLQD